MNIKNGLLLTATCLLILFALPDTGLSQTKTVTDEMGRTMSVPVNPMRVIALAPSITEIIFDLGQEHRLKGATMFSNYPPETAKLPKVGSYMHLDLEKIVALKPDLCIGIKDGNPIGVVRRLDALNIPVYAVNPTNFDSVTKTILKIGTLLNSPDRAKSLVENLTKRISTVRSKISNTDYRPGVFFQIGITPIVSAGYSTFTHEMIILAGGRNLAQGPTAYPRFSREQVLSLMPDVIIIASMAREGGFEQVKTTWKSWPQLPAVQNNHIFIIDADLVNRPTARLVQGLETIAKLIHPKLFPE
ncbi:MAG: cobalamin-binding protein [Desulfobacterales bacterium]|nr:cobalamin-binding protein [Desulfobacterales bacterium]